MSQPSPLPSGWGMVLRFQFLSRVTTWEKSRNKSDCLRNKEELKLEILTVVELLVDTIVALDGVIAKDDSVD